MCFTYELQFLDALLLEAFALNIYTENIEYNEKKITDFYSKRIPIFQLNLIYFTVLFCFSVLWKNNSLMKAVKYSVRLPMTDLCSTLYFVFIVNFYCVSYFV